MAYTLVLPFHGDLTSLTRTARRAREEGGAFDVREVLLAHNGAPLSPEKQAIVDAMTAPAEEGKPAVRFVHTDAKGLGAGYKLAIAEAREEFLVLSGDDLPFGWSDIRGHKAAGSPDFAIGSKAHADSRVLGLTRVRQVSTLIFRLLRLLVLGRKTPGDSQGSVMVRADIAKRLLPELRHDDYLSSLEIAMLHIYDGGTVVEVPIRIEHVPHPSSVSVLRDGAVMARGLLEIRSRRR